MIFTIIIMAAELGAWILIGTGVIDFFSVRESETNPVVFIFLGMILGAIRLILFEMEPWGYDKSAWTRSKCTRQAPPATKVEIWLLRGMLTALALMSTLLFLVMNEVKPPALPEDFSFIVLHALAGLLSMIPGVLLACAVMRRAGIR